MLYAQETSTMIPTDEGAKHVLANPKTPTGKHLSTEWHDASMMRLKSGGLNPSQAIKTLDTKT